MAYRGKFIPKNPHKYRGDPTNIVWRSSWELRVMRNLDENPNILEWSSEEIIVPYISPIDNKRHRYYPDMVAKTKQIDGSIKTMMIEIKPKKETVEPKPQKKRTKKYINEVMTWAKNSAKWTYAREYCADRNWDFVLLTEDQIFDKPKR